MVFDIFFLILFLAFFLFFTVQAYNMIFRGYAPFIATKNKVIKRVVDELELPAGTVVYELGSGRAGFLRALRKKFPQTELIGFEYSWLPFLIGGMQNALAGSGIKLRRQNFMKADLSQADLIYCYLSDNTMAKLEPKFRQECKSGARIISNSFSIPNMAATRTLTWEGKPDKVYFYMIN